VPHACSSNSKTSRLSQRVIPLTNSFGMSLFAQTPNFCSPSTNTTPPPPMDSVSVWIRRHRLSINNTDMRLLPCRTRAVLTRWQSRVLTVAPSLRWQLSRRRRSPRPHTALALSWHPLQPADTKQRALCRRPWPSFHLPTFCYSMRGSPSPSAALPHVGASQTQEQPPQKNVALKTEQVSEEKLLTLHSDSRLTKPVHQGAQKTVTR